MDMRKSEGYETVLVVINRLMKMRHFIPGARDLDGKQFANLFKKERVGLHGQAEDISTDMGTLFTSALLKQTPRKLGLEQGLTTAFHLERDEETGRTNAML